MSRHLDVDGARDRLREHQAAELPRARLALSEAERERALAEANLARLKGDYVAGEITATEWRELRTDLGESLTATSAAVGQAQHRVEAIMASETTTDEEAALLRHLADLRALVCGTVEQARDVEGLRTVIRHCSPRSSYADPRTPSAAVPKVI